MIAYVHGTLGWKTEKSCLVLTPGGVGYEVLLTVPALSCLPPKDEEIAFHVHTVVREDAIELYGFATPEERRYFNILISIAKLGPKKALAILSTFSPERLRQIAAMEDVTAMSTVSGIGKKSAHQIVWELKHKLKDEVPARGGGEEPTIQPGEFGDALAGLVNLGYADEEVRPMLAEVFDADPDLDAASAVREVLKKIARSKG